jgi:hypothetical protein
MSALRLSTLAALALATVACTDNTKSTNQLPTAPMGVAPGSVSAVVAGCNPNPALGARVVVWVRARRGTSVGPIGSFTIRLAYDSTKLHFQDAARSAQGMVMANGERAGVVLAAGAAAEGFTDDVLLVSTFEVVGSNALKSLELGVTELNSVAFKDQRAYLNVERALYRAPSESR